MLSDYLPIVVLAALAAIFAVASLVASSLLGPRKPNPVKLMAYESGNDPIRLPRGQRFSVKFYVVAMLFIIFDIETIFLFPWAIAFRQLGLFGLVEMAIFIGLVFVAYVYVWKKGGLDWAGSAVTPVETDDEIRDELGVGRDHSAGPGHDGSPEGPPSTREEAARAR